MEQREKTLKSGMILLKGCFSLEKVVLK